MDRLDASFVRGGMKFLIRALLPAFALLAAAPIAATADDLRSVAGMRTHNRILIVFSPSLHDPRLTAQSAVMAQLGLEAAERDLLFVQVDPMTVIGASDKADSLRRRFHVPVETYHAMLIGKDGTVALESATIIQAPQLLHAIDSMPMRQAEAARAKAGLPRAQP
jgi:hypothetical protein